MGREENPVESWCFQHSCTLQRPLSSDLQLVELQIQERYRRNGQRGRRLKRRKESTSLRQSESAIETRV